MKSEFYYPSEDQKTQIHAIEWTPDGEVKAVLQLCHGMTEYMNRYHDFAQYLSKQGYYVVGNDHLGHGKSVSSETEYGFFDEKHGNEYVLGDMHSLRVKTAFKYPEIPFFLLGHSMGSFLVRQYIQKYGQDLSGVIIMGTGCQPGISLVGGKLLCKIIGAVKGNHYRSKLIDNMAVGGYNRRFEPARTPSDWLTKDTEIVDSYVKDPWCTFVFTVNAYYHMFCGMQKLGKRHNMEAIPKELPILLTSGKEDPVGNFGKGVEKILQTYQKCGMKDVTLKMYEGDRHEILNEINRQEVYEDLYHWMEEKSIRKKYSASR